MSQDATHAVEVIPIDCITVVNPRVRNKRAFKEIVANIAAVGLKRPITVSRREEADGIRYDLVCGQGRLEAYQALGQREIPAIVVDASTEDCMVMSLVENLARRQHRALDLLHDIDGLKRRGYSEPEIARKIDVSVEYVRGVIKLLRRGELRLLRAVEAGQIPVSTAVDIADANDAGLQHVLQQAYEANVLRGRRLLIAKRLIEQRQRKGPGLSSVGPKRTKQFSSDALVRAYRTDADRKRMLIRKADTTRDRLVFVTAALRSLFADENLVALLRSEGLNSLPADLAGRIQNEARI